MSAILDTGLKIVHDLTKQELEQRLQRFCAMMDKEAPVWDTAIFLGRVNQYYFSGNMQDGMLVITRDRKLYFFVRRSVERAKRESPWPIFTEWKATAMRRLISVKIWATPM